MRPVSPWTVGWSLILVLAACRQPAKAGMLTVFATAEAMIQESTIYPESLAGRAVDSLQASSTITLASVTETPGSTSTIAGLTTPAAATRSAARANETAQPLIYTTVSAADEYVIVPSVPPVGVARPTVYLTTINIPTYQYEQAFVPTAPDDPIFPYPGLDFEAVGPPVPRSYQAIVLENGFNSITILPELGGRIYRWIDKATGRHLLYENPVVKPTSWGYRGWWLAAGGIEWAFPLTDHGLVEYQPWQYTIGDGSVTVSSIDQRSGMEVGATISLPLGQAYLIIQPWARNNTNDPHQYQLWLNAMLTLGGNSVSPQTQFIVPANQVIVHSAGFGGAPSPGASMAWPWANGRDMSWYGVWEGYFGFFVTGVSFTGLYDHDADQGIVRVHLPGWPVGTKFFGPATLSPANWTDDGSNYLELWSGATANFWSNAMLAPGDSVGWTERWYPVSRMGGFNFANARAALKLVDSSGGAEIAAAVSSAINGVIHLYVASHEVANWPARLSPGQAFRASWSRPAELQGALGLTLEDAQGIVVAQTGQLP